MDVSWNDTSYSIHELYEIYKYSNWVIPENIHTTPTEEIGS